MNDWFSKCQRNWSERYPLLCQLCINVISALVVTCLLWFWVKVNVLYKTIAKTLTISQNMSQVTIRNDGIMPSNAVYSIATGDTVVVKPFIKSGNEYISGINPVEGEKYKIYLNGLPANQVVRVDFNTGKIKAQKE